MSTDYYLACPQCQECVHIAQDGFSGFSFYSGEPDCMKTLGKFMKEHILHTSPLIVMREQDVEEFKRWDWPVANNL